MRGTTWRGIFARPYRMYRLSAFTPRCTSSPPNPTMYMRVIHFCASLNSRSEGPPDNTRHVNQRVSQVKGQPTTRDVASNVCQANCPPHQPTHLEPSVLEVIL